MLRTNKQNSILVEQHVPLFNLLDYNLRITLILSCFKLVSVVIAAWIAIVVGGQPAHALCTAETPVCAAKAGVFAIQSFHPAASATRIGPDLLVTNRHVVANQAMAHVLVPDGARLDATVVSSSYPGDLIMLRVPDLPPGPVLVPGPTPSTTTPLQTIGYDVGRQAIRIYAPGQITAIPPANAPLARVHHNAPSQPGNSGGALVNSDGLLLAIVAAGGEGRHDGIPATEIKKLKSLSGPAHQAAHDQISLAYRQCTAATDAAVRGRRPLTHEQSAFLDENCQASKNRQLLDLAAQIFGRRGHFDESVDLFTVALDQDPNAINTRLSLVVTLHLAGRYEDEIPHLKVLINTLPADVQVLRFAIQAGIWGNAPDLADRGMALLKQHHPQLAPLADRFRNAPPPPPQGR